jgi:alpha-tubulin suppressor-like RCC1 family protein
MSIKRIALAVLVLGLLGSAITIGMRGSRPASAAFIETVSGGGFHTCALTTNETIKCWGLNTRGQVGDGTSGNLRTLPVDVLESLGGPTLGVVVQVAAGGAHTCALLDTGSVKCWGRNEEGQLGDGAGGGVGDFSASPVDVSGLTSVASISSGTGHTCAVTNTGGATCWGDNASGQLGDGTNTEATTPVDVSGLASGVAAVSAGESHTCAVLTTGQVRCWGQNSFGQLGDNSNSPSNTPVTVCSDAACSGALAGISDVSAGGLHACARTSSGGAKCWGFNGAGQLGDNSLADRDTPVNVSGLTSGVIQVSAGREHTCARTSGGGAKCWGRNTQGQVGDASNTDRDEPVDVSGLTSGTATLSAGGFHSCAVRSGAGVFCWGRNVDGQLGIGSIGTKQNAPVEAVHAKGTPTLTPTLTHTATLTPYNTPKPTKTPAPTPTANGTATGSLIVDADCEDPLGPPKDSTLAAQRTALVGTTFHICVTAGFPSSSAAGFHLRIHWTEAFLNLVPRAASVNDVWQDQPSGDGGPPNGSSPTQMLGPADDKMGDDAYVLLQSVDALGQDSAPPYQGPVTQFEFTCQAHGSAIIELRDPGLSGGSSYISGGSPIKTTLKPAFITCLDPAIDSDVDGCTNSRELGTPPNLGGQRDPFRFWDVFDTPTGANGAKDKTVSGLDFFALLGRFGAMGSPTIDPLSLPPPAPAYHTAYDRGPSSGPNVWNLMEANGSIGGTDFFAVLGQFGLNCQ